MWKYHQDDHVERLKVFKLLFMPESISAKYLLRSNYLQACLQYYTMGVHIASAPTPATISHQVTSTSTCDEQSLPAPCEEKSVRIGVRSHVEDTILAPASFLATRLRSQHTRTERSSDLPAFYRNIEKNLDLRRNSRSLYTIVQNYWQTSNAIDFCSGDILSLNATGKLRAEFINELANHPSFTIGSGGVRLMDGNYSYLEQAERDIASFHGAEEGMLVGSAFEANVAVWTALPQPGDVLVYDKLVHASTHEGMKKSRAKQRVEFLHNDLNSFRDTVVSILEHNIAIREGQSSILVAVESIYSMDGDVCPLREMIDIGKELCSGPVNIQFVVDEAHSVGVIGPKGAGLVCELGLEKDVAVVVHSYGKAMGSTGGTYGSFVINDAFANNSSHTQPSSSARKQSATHS